MVPSLSSTLTVDTNGNNVTLSKAIPNGGYGTFVVTGSGTLTLKNGFGVGSGGSFGALVINGGTLVTPAGIYPSIGGGIGDGPGTAVQTGGRFLVNQTLLINRSTNAASSYSISAGTLTANGGDFGIDFNDGTSSANVGTFNQTGGLVNCTTSDVPPSLGKRPGAGNLQPSGRVLNLTNGAAGRCSPAMLRDLARPAPATLSSTSPAARLQVDGHRRQHVGHHPECATVA